MHVAEDREYVEAVRLRFFREFRGPGGCHAVSVRHSIELDALVIEAGTTDPEVNFPKVYEGLPVQQQLTPEARHAVFWHERRRVTVRADGEQCTR